jgi:selenide, water dikinase
MLRASGVAGRIDSRRVPLLPGARELAAAGHVPGGTLRNFDDVSKAVDFADSVDRTARLILADAQTSGGLLMCVPPEAVDDLLSELEGRTPAAVVIGEVREGEAGRIEVV